MVSERTEASVDLVLAGRYRLLRPITRHRVSTLWRGVDEVLARPVAVRTLERPETVEGGKDAYLAAAVLAGRLAHPRIASIYDAAEESGLPYVVSEWVDGGSLAALLAQGPLEAPHATTVAAQVAEAMTYAHRRGVAHLDLDTLNVLLCADGSTKVTDFQLGALLRAAADRTPPPSRGEDGVLDPAAEARDVRSLGALLYACLTARSAYGGEGDLPAAPTRDGALLSPRQVRAGVPRELDAIVAGILLPGRSRSSIPISSATDLVAALARLPGVGTTSRPSEPVPLARPERRRVTRWLRWGVPALLVAGLGAAALAAGYSIGELPRPPGAISPLEAPASAVPAAPDAGASPTLTAAARVVAVSAFDPPPGDGQERNQTVPLATDGDPSTAWETVLYRTADFGRLKDGVGLLFDLGSAVKVRSVEVAFAQKGLSVQMRAANVRGSTAADFRVVAEADDAGTRATFRPGAGTAPARYWLVWVTRLTRSGDKFKAGVAEVAFGR
ncbi:MAG TPA: serine/threonine-protein kinase [Mycobacteriales bacterium]|nr:serine/threonine-protein kinase [Mycobacteriales bacterium]